MSVSQAVGISGSLCADANGLLISGTKYNFVIQYCGMEYIYGLLNYEFIYLKAIQYTIACR